MQAPESTHPNRASLRTLRGEKICMSDLEGSSQLPTRLKVIEVQRETACFKAWVAQKRFTSKEGPLQGFNTLTFSY